MIISSSSARTESLLFEIGRPLSRQYSIRYINGIMVIYGINEKKRFLIISSCNMFISRICSLGLIKYQYSWISSSSRCFLSNVSPASSRSSVINEEENSADQKQKQTLSITKSISENATNNDNEWLWAYLRERKTFADLSEEQRRRVVEIGSIIQSFISKISFSFRHCSRTSNHERKWRTCT